VHRRVFEEAGLAHVWPRVIALVVQPGVEFNHDSVVNYAPERAAHLAALLDEEQGMVFEAHSTDYQRPQAYRALVHDGFAILKVGPALSFAMREALEALSLIEAELVAPEKCSRLMDVLEKVMLDDPRNWEHHYAGDEHAKRLLRRYSYSDRLRYYWNDPRVKQAVDTMMANLRELTIPQTLLSAYLPDQYRSLRAGTLKLDAHSIILDRIREVIGVYAEACKVQTLYSSAPQI
jgi:D-tagatose-1,6-bisphosphate aldolase subunit GatZ/KbaZ